MHSEWLKKGGRRVAVMCGQILIRAGKRASHWVGVRRCLRDTGRSTPMTLQPLHHRMNMLSYHLLYHRLRSTVLLLSGALSHTPTRILLPP
jgi:hypothetical protein